MRLPPAIIVHGLRQVLLALASGRPLTLLSAPGAGNFGGCLWWKSLLDAAGYTGDSLLDCGDAPGRAVEALRLGLPGVVLTCAPAAYTAVAGIAAVTGARLLAVAPPALDLGQRGAERRLAAWLADDSAAGLG